MIMLLSFNQGGNQFDKLPCNFTVKEGRFFAKMGIVVAIS